ncbi:MAG: thiosulfate oxidation carrier protein SoxY [Burkholderiaceae bacterium]
MSRRQWLIKTTPWLLLGPAAGLAQPARLDNPDARLDAAIRDFTQGRPVESAPEAIRIEMDALVENGNSVPVRLKVQSPMTAEHHVQRILLLAPRNPQPQVALFYLGPYSGRAEVSTRFRMAESQTLIALAAHNDGRIVRAQAEVIVTLAACLEN